jgi:hypothetical protein
LSRLTGLENLELSNNLITDVTPLGGLTNLGAGIGALMLRNNQITDPMPLAFLTRLDSSSLQPRLRGRRDNGCTRSRSGSESDANHADARALARDGTVSGDGRTGDSAICRGIAECARQLSDCSDCRTHHQRGESGGSGRIADSAECGRVAE